jgi:hypothetical protein
MWVVKEPLIKPSSRRRPGSNALVFLDSGLRRNDVKRFIQRFPKEPLIRSSIMTRYLLTLFLGSLLLSSPTFGAGVGLSPGGISFSDGTFQSTAALPPLPPGMAWVAMSGGDYTSPVDAMNDLSSWCQLVNNAVPHGARCTLLIAPGSYDLGTDRLVMRADVDIVGMGNQSTVLYGYAGSAVWDETSALVRGAAWATLRNLSISNSDTGASRYSAAIYNNGPGFHVDHVSIHATGFDQVIGIANDSVDATYTNLDVVVSGNTLPAGKFCSGIHVLGAGKVLVNHAKVVVSGCDTDSTAIQNNGGNLQLVRVDASANCTGTSCAYGVWNSSIAGGVISILDSQIEAVYRSLNIYSSSDRIINTRLSGPINDPYPAPSHQCRGTYNSNLAKVDC